MTPKLSPSASVLSVAGHPDHVRAGDTDLLLWRDSRGMERRFLATDGVATRDLARGTSWAIPSRHHGQPSLTGDYFFASVGKHIAYASLTEYTLLLLLDHEGTVDAILAQPFLMKFDRDGVKLRHIPDYYVRRTNGHEEVWDVRPYSRIDGRLKEGAALTREFCWRADLDYHLYDGIEPVVRRNLEWLHAYSFERYAPRDTRDIAALTDFFGNERSIRDALDEFDARESDMRCWIYHLLWMGALVSDLSRPLSSHTPLIATNTKE